MDNPTLRQKLWFAYAVFVIMWPILCYAKLGQFLYEGTLFARVLNNRPHVSDFVNVYSASLLAKRSMSEPTNIYDLPVQADLQAKLVAPVVPELPVYLQYPPHFFALMLPLALFTMPVAWCVWVLLGAALIVMTVKSLLADQGGKFTRVFWYAAVFCSYPTWLSVELGQTSLIILLPMLIFWQSFERGKTFLAAAASALISIKLQYIPFIGMAGLALGKVKYFGLALACGAALLLISGAILGFHNIIAYPNALLSGETGSQVAGVSAHEMQNLRGFLTLLIRDDKLVSMVSMVGFAIGTISIGWLWTRQKQLSEKHEGAFQIMAAVSVLLMLLSSPHTHTQDYLLLAIACFWLWQWCQRELSKQSTDGRTKAFKWLNGLLVAFPGLSWIMFIFKPFFQAVYIQPFFVWACAVLVISLIQLFRVSPGAPAESSPAKTSPA